MKTVNELFDFSGKVIIITGGAGAIGSAAARRFASLGANVVISDINQEKLDELAADIEKESAHATLGFKADSTVEAELQALVDATIGKFGKISGLINNVGWGAATPLWESDTDKMVKSYLLNTVGAYNLTKMCMPYLKKELNASVVFSGSMVGVTPSPEFIEYSTAKAGLLNMVHSMAVMSGPEVRFNSLIIGSVDNGAATLAAGYDPAMLQRLSDAMVLKRRGEPEDIANAFMFLMSGAASWITGIDLKVDGGGMYTSKMPKK
ncbi:3-oxoacyl-[acyl-carrier protein] reductase [Mucinivorans hirudinis]|uniref:3-oxoacyl-[acyl-carrier protein] reductase n=1 Tax=Mucinivorans hirudinis TaxID=1433126 RepID=A0A060RB84_9BACT|nr:3-oxoacyl-[acyl-carrier protein] reductase [Mucinivorans hirudinis]